MTKYNSNQLPMGARFALLGSALLAAFAMFVLTRVINACNERDAALIYAEGYYGSCVSESPVPEEEVH